MYTCSETKGDQRYRYVHVESYFHRPWDAFGSPGLRTPSKGMRKDWRIVVGRCGVSASVVVLPSSAAELGQSCLDCGLLATQASAGVHLSRSRMLW